MKLDVINLKYKGQILSILIVLCLTLLTFVYQAAINNFIVYMIGIGIVITLLAWWLGRQVDTSSFQNKCLKDNNEELEEVNKAYDQIFDSNTVNVFSYDLKHNTLTVSRGIQNIYGISREEFLNKPTLWKGVIFHEDLGLVKDIEKKLLLGENVKYEHRIVRPDGEMLWIEINSIGYKDSKGNTVKINGSVTDINERKKLEEKLKQMAYYDKLTDLPNRQLLERHLHRGLARSKRNNHSLGIMFIDLDGFKKVNDTLGHESGDLLLKEVANRLTLSVREEDLISRIGGDEFIIVFEETEKDTVKDIADRIITNVSATYTINEQQTKISPSIGISMFPFDAEDKETLIQNADKAMYYAKSKGKNNYQFYSQDIPEILGKKFNVLDKIKESVAKFSR